MNRLQMGKRMKYTGIPRIRGDEPDFPPRFCVKRQVFPASAGMNRPPVSCPSALQRIPRIRGDEPS